MALTAYVVLERISDGLADSWKVLGIQEASGNESAARKMAKSLGREGAFVGIPTRSFQPVNVAKRTFERTVVTKVDYLNNKKEAVVAA